MLCVLCSPQNTFYPSAEPAENRNRICVQPESKADHMADKGKWLVAHDPNIERYVHTVLQTVSNNFSYRNFNSHSADAKVTFCQLNPPALKCADVMLICLFVRLPWQTSRPLSVCLSRLVCRRYTVGTCEVINWKTVLYLNLRFCWERDELIMTLYWLIDWFIDWLTSQTEIFRGKL